MKHSKTLLAAALGLLVASAMPAHAGDKKVNNYVRSSDGSVVRDGSGDCVRSSDKTTVLLEECGYAAKVVVKKSPEMVEVAVVESGTVLEHVVVENIQFAFDSAELTAQAKTMLDDAVARLTPYKELIRNQTTSVTITGYTDTSGPEDYNLKLSERRANAVADYMANSLGVDRGRMSVSGMGEANPIADNATRAGRIKNRRVEVDVIQK
jgi:outer membrane protein OmpA-like peptidoglycan-associated protein